MGGKYVSIFGQSNFSSFSLFAIFHNFNVNKLNHGKSELYWTKSESRVELNSAELKLSEVEFGFDSILSSLVLFLLVKFYFAWFLKFLRFWNLLILEVNLSFGSTSWLTVRSVNPNLAKGGVIIIICRKIAISLEPSIWWTSDQSLSLFTSVSKSLKLIFVFLVASWLN